MKNVIDRLLVHPVVIPVGMGLLLVLAISSGRRPDRDDRGRPIVVYAHPPCPPELMAFYRPAFEEFRRTHPDIDFRVLHITGNYEDKIKVMFAGKVAPDVIFMYPTALPAWVTLGALEPLDDLLARDPTVGREDYFEPAIATFSYGGRIYGLPKDASATIMEYNVALFRELGIPKPGPKWTWTDLLAAGKKLTADTDGDGRVDRWGLDAPPWWVFVWQNGGRILDPSGARCTLLEPRAIEALEFWAALRWKYQVTPTPEAHSDMSFSRMFVLERVGMMFAMYPVVSILRKQCDFEWDIAPMPAGPRGRATDFVGSALAVTRQSRNKAAAFEWVRWMTSPAGMRNVISFEFPSCRALAESAEWTNSAPTPASKQVAVEAMAYARPPMQHPRYQEIMDALNPELEKAQRGMISVRRALKNAVPRVDEILRRTGRRGTHAAPGA